MNAFGDTNFVKFLQRISDSVTVKNGRIYSIPKQTNSHVLELIDKTKSYKFFFFLLLYLILFIF